MVRQLTFPLVIISFLFYGCVGGLSPIDSPPIPTTKSICPLGIGNHWEYWYTRYDSAGNSIPLTDRTLSRSIPGGLALYNDSLYTPGVSNYNGQNSYEGTAIEYLYKFEWEDLDSGLLVRHIGDGELSKRGLYIEGRYVHQSASLFDSSILWLAYPGSAGTKWTVDLPDDSASFTMEIVSTDARFYIPSGSGERTSPLFFRDSCYLYKETTGDYNTYYYYHPDAGCLGYMQYKNGKLEVTYILTSFTTIY